QGRVPGERLLRGGHPTELPHSWWLRLFQGIRDRAVDARRAVPVDRRGHQGGPEEHHQQATTRRLPDLSMTAPDFAFRPQLAEDVARYVRKRIFDGTYAAGQYIRLGQLATELGVSVTPVREALFVLSAEGLLSQQPRRGFVVVSLTGRDLTDVANVQAHIGGELAARAAVNITDEQLRELEKVQTELEDAYASDDDDRAVRLNHEFHKAINVAADSPKLAQLMSQINRCAPESVFPTITVWPDQSTEHHRKLLAALEERDEDLARTLMSEHLAAGASPLIEHLTARCVAGVLRDDTATRRCR